MENRVKTEYLIAIVPMAGMENIQVNQEVMVGMVFELRIEER
ncbi:hypothetical protein [Xenorhabdus kozodoii]|nr:hypothetical protein [Xenorhabdus kozodoii]